MIAEDALRDWAGAAHTPVAKGGNPPRIASLVPSLTELLFVLGLGESVVARTGFCVHPRGAVARIPKLGGTKDPDLGRLRALAPTHLIVNVDENRREVVDAARAFIPEVVVTHPVAIEDNPRLYRLVGAIFLRDDRAAALAREFSMAVADLDAAVATLARERVLYLIWRRPWMTVAHSTYIASMLRRAGWDAIAPNSPQRYPEVDPDDPVWREADRILLSSEPFAFRARDARELAATTGKPVQLVDGEMTSWYGPRAVAGLRYLARLRAAVAAGAAPE